ncbi:MAG: hypothetical protein ACW990_19945 [Promethearchaeota archaeon]|jgi:hypothetical protein
MDNPSRTNISKKKPDVKSISVSFKIDIPEEKYHKGLIVFSLMFSMFLFFTMLMLTFTFVFTFSGFRVCFPPIEGLSLYGELSIFLISRCEAVSYYH